MVKSVIAFILSVVPLAAHPDPSHTLAEINQHLQDSPEDIGLLYRKVELLLRTGHPADAAPVLAGALRRSPGDPRLLLLDARLAEQMGEREKAASMVAALVRRFPKDADAWGMHARLAYEAGRAGDAISAKLRQIEIESGTNAGDYLTCAAWLREKAHPGDLETAIRVMDGAILHFGCQTGLQEVAIRMECSLARYDEALRRVDLLVRKFRPSASFSMLRADIFEAAGRHREAASACDSAIALMSMRPGKGEAGEEVAAQIQKLKDRKAEHLERAAASIQP